MNKIWQKALINSFLTTLYIYSIGMFLFYAGSIKLGKTNAFLAPIAFLLLFVLSAGLTSFLVFGKPVLLYLDGKKKESISLLMYTFVFLFAFTFLSIAILFLLK